jgi:3'(2'), 5'-bisphosphate nucleotidase
LSRATHDVPARLAFAGRVAQEAGRRILEHYGATEHETKPGGSPVTEADLAANRIIVESIFTEWPGEPVLAEESRDSAERLGHSDLWIVDPLDGTREFLARNGEFAVMIGFVAEGEPVAGVVYLPARGLLYEAGSGQGAWAIDAAGNRRRLQARIANPASLRMVGSRSHPDPLLQKMQQALHIQDIRPSGSVGVKCGLIAEAERDVYIHPVPYLKEWDTCAPEVLMREAGGTVTDCLGDRLGYNKRRPDQPHGIVAAAAAVHERVIRTVRPIYEAALRERQASPHED